MFCIVKSVFILILPAILVAAPLGKENNSEAELAWNFATNLTEENRVAMINSRNSHDNGNQYRQLDDAISIMIKNYASSTVCSYTECNNNSMLNIQDIQDIYTNSRDPKELSYYWREWHNKAGSPMKSYFQKYVKLSNNLTGK